MPLHMQEINKKKRLCMFGEILRDLGYPDVSLVDHIAFGFPISGWLPESNIFPLETQRPEYDVATIMKMAQGLNKWTKLRWRPGRPLSKRLTMGLS